MCLAGLIASSASGSAVSAEALEPAPVEAAESTLITDLPSFWLDGVRDKVRPIKMELVVNHYDPSWNILWVDVKGNLGYLKGASNLPIRSGDRILVEGTVIPVNGISAETVRITVLEHTDGPQPIEVGGKLSEFAALKAQEVTFEATFDREQTSGTD